MVIYRGASRPSSGGDGGRRGLPTLNDDEDFEDDDTPEDEPSIRLVADPSLSSVSAVRTAPSADPPAPPTVAVSPQPLKDPPVTSHDEDEVDLNEDPTDEGEGAPSGFDTEDPQDEDDLEDEDGDDEDDDEDAADSDAVPRLASDTAEPPRPAPVKALPPPASTRPAAPAPTSASKATTKAVAKVVDEGRTRDVNLQRSVLDRVDEPAVRKLPQNDDTLGRKTSSPQAPAAVDKRLSYKDMNDHEYLIAACERFQNMPEETRITIRRTVPEPVTAFQSVMASAYPTFDLFKNFVMNEHWTGRTEVFEWLVTCKGKRIGGVRMLRLEQDNRRKLEWQQRQREADEMLRTGRVPTPPAPVAPQQSFTEQLAQMIEAMQVARGMMLSPAEVDQLRRQLQANQDAGTAPPAAAVQVAPAVAVQVAPVAVAPVAPVLPVLVAAETAPASMPSAGPVAPAGPSVMPALPAFHLPPPSSPPAAVPMRRANPVDLPTEPLAPDRGDGRGGQYGYGPPRSLIPPRRTRAPDSPNERGRPVNQPKTYGQPPFNRDRFDRVVDSLQRLCDEEGYVIPVEEIPPGPGLIPPPRNVAPAAPPALPPGGSPGYSQAHGQPQLAAPPATHGLVPPPPPPPPAPEMGTPPWRWEGQQLFDGYNRRCDRNGYLMPQAAVPPPPPPPPPMPIVPAATTPGVAPFAYDPAGRIVDAHGRLCDAQGYLLSPVVGLPHQAGVHGLPMAHYPPPTLLGAPGMMPQAAPASAPAPAPAAPPAASQEQPVMGMLLEFMKSSRDESRELMREMTQRAEKDRERLERSLEKVISAREHAPAAAPAAQHVEQVDPLKMMKQSANMVKEMKSLFGGEEDSSGKGEREEERKSANDGPPSHTFDAGGWRALVKTNKDGTVEYDFNPLTTWQLNGDNILNFLKGGVEQLTKVRDFEKDQVESQNRAMERRNQIVKERLELEQKEANIAVETAKAREKQMQLEEEERLRRLSQQMFGHVTQVHPPVARPVHQAPPGYGPPPTQAQHPAHAPPIASYGPPPVAQGVSAPSMAHAYGTSAAIPPRKAAPPAAPSPPVAPYVNAPSPMVVDDEPVATRAPSVPAPPVATPSPPPQGGGLSILDLAGSGEEAPGGFTPPGGWNTPEEDTSDLKAMLEAMG